MEGLFGSCHGGLSAALGLKTASAFFFFDRFLSETDGASGGVV